MSKNNLSSVVVVQARAVDKRVANRSQAFALLITEQRSKYENSKNASYTSYASYASYASYTSYTSYTCYTSYRIHTEKVTISSGAIWWPNLQLMQVAPSGGQICNLCKWRHLVANFATNASGTIWWPIWN